MSDPSYEDLARTPGEACGETKTARPGGFMQSCSLRRGHAGPHWVIPQGWRMPEVVADDSVPPDELHLRDEDGRTVGVVRLT